MVRPTYDHRDDAWVRQRAPQRQASYTIAEPRREETPDDETSDYTETVGLAVKPPDGDHSTLTIAHTTVSSTVSTQFVGVDVDLVDSLVDAITMVGGESGSAETDEWLPNLRPEDRDVELQHVIEPYNDPDDPEGVETMGVAVVPPRNDSGCITIANTSSGGPLMERYVSFGPQLVDPLAETLERVAEQVEPE